ncbi:MAG: dihydrodipicolinate synthase family protein [Bacteroidales bacterium]|nr:dihydrodipicolinate synthase family protein [Bacteroidales bacterium]
MKQSRSNFHLEGIVPPVVTPLLQSNTLDHSGLENLVNHIIQGGVSGLFILGTTGEISRLSNQLREDVIRKTMELVHGRVPVLVGITDTSIHETLRLEQIARECGADAVVLAPPFYYHVEQNELVAYFNEVADTITLPLFLYNMPSRTHIHIETETVVAISEHPNIIGIKDSSGDLIYLQSLIYTLGDRKDFSIFVGPEEIMAQAVLLGADGGVNGGANLYPKLYVDLFEAAVDKDIKRVNVLQNVVTQISSTLYKVGVQEPNFTKIIKEALSQIGICGPYMEKPYIPFSQEDKAKIAECLQKIKVAVPA